MATDEIVVPPQPLVATCPQCKMERSLPEGWEDMLREQAGPAWDGVLRCLNTSEHEEAIEMAVQYRHEEFLIRTEDGPHPGSFVGTAADGFGWPLPERLPDSGGWYVRVSMSTLPPMPPDGHVVRGASYKWVPADAN